LCLPVEALLGFASLEAGLHVYARILAATIVYLFAISSHIFLN